MRGFSIISSVAAEEQEFKEAFLAYYFLLTASDPPDQATLEARIEEWLKKTFGVDINFEVDDALAKLERLGLLKREGEETCRSSVGRSARSDLGQFFLFANEADGRSRQAKPPRRLAFDVLS